MNWSYNYITNINNLERINKNSYILRLSKNNLYLLNDSAFTIRYLSIKVKSKPTLDSIKNILLSLQTEYDNSNEVNSFYIDGNKCWFDKATRVGLVNAINLKKQLNETTYKVWFNDTAVEISTDRALTLLATIENYAAACYNNTQKHITEIKQLETIEDCLEYDITAGYPEILNITLTDGNNG